MTDQPIPFGKYFLLERVNVGGMAEVFKGKAFGVEGFERLVAVKRILPAIAEDTDFITMFVDEAKIAVQLTHANIAQIFDLGKVDDSYFIAMEYIHGKDLRAVFDRMRKRGETIPIPMCCYVVMKACEGLDYAHNKRDPSGRDLTLVHRDVSPQNVLISYDGEVKIIDFGIAKATGKVGTTQAGMLKGKFGYMSPEQVQGVPIDRRADIFAIGIVLYELLTGERLFIGESDFATLEKIKAADVIPPSTYNPRIPEELERVVMKALTKSATDRYQTAMDLHDDLQSFMYTSGNFFARKDLSLVMRELFAEEIQREKARDEEYQKIEAPPPSNDDIATPAIDLVRALKPSWRGGYDSFQHTPPTPPPRSSVAPPTPLPSQRAKAGSSAPRNDGASAQVWQGSTEVESSPSVKMDWDEEEVSTEIYDKPGQLKLPPTMPEPARASGAAGGAVAPPGRKSAAPPVTGAGGPAHPPGASVPPPVPRAMSSLPPPPPRTLTSSVAPPAPSPASASPGSGAPPTEATAPEVDLPPGPRISAPSPFAPGPVTAVTPASYSAGMATPPPGLVPFGGGAGAGFPSGPTFEGSQTVATSRRWPLERTLLVGAIGVLAVVATCVVSAAVLLRPKVGGLKFEAVPADNLRVRVDGQTIDSARSPFHLEVEEGAHVLEVAADGFVTAKRDITVVREATTEVGRIVLEKESSRVSKGTGFSLETEPKGARVLVDGVELPERTPIEVTTLTAGPHVIEVRHDGNYAPYKTQITVGENQVLALPELVLQQDSVRVTFDSEPPGAEITLVRGSVRESVGRSPARAAVQISLGAWTVEMRAEGYRDWSAPLVVPPGRDEVSVRARLEALDGAGGAGGAGGGGDGARESATRGTREGSRAGSSQRTPRETAAEPTREAPRETAPREQVEREPAADREDGMGTLQINTRPWSQVYVDGRFIGNVPQMAISLRAGDHRVTLVNPEFDIRQTITVSIKAGETTRRVITLEE
jgi:serine/threonine protein kinase